LLKIKAPANSPDLNPIEMVWNQMKDYVRSKFCKNIEEIVLAVNEFRLNYPLNYCENTINKLHKVFTF
jgi:transposase